MCEGVTGEGGECAKAGGRKRSWSTGEWLEMGSAGRAGVRLEGPALKGLECWHFRLPQVKVVLPHKATLVLFPKGNHNLEFLM